MGGIRKVTFFVNLPTRFIATRSTRGFNAAEIFTEGVLTYIYTPRDSQRSPREVRDWTAYKHRRIYNFFEELCLSGKIYSVLSDVYL